MEFMPFAHINDRAFLELFPKSGDLAYDEDGEWVYFNGEWLLLGPSVDGISYEEYGFLEDYEDYPQDHEDYPQDQDNEAQLNDALHFGYETYGQDGPPAPLLPDPLDYDHYDYDDPRDA